MYRHVLTLLISLLVYSLPAVAIEIEGIEIPETDSSADSNTTLILNGAGLREKFFIDVYIGALYLQAKTPDAHAILSDDGPARIGRVSFSKTGKTGTSSNPTIRRLLTWRSCRR